MAEKKSKKSYWIGAGALLAGMVLVLSIFIGPAVLECRGDDKGFSACLAQQLSNSDERAAPDATATAKAEPAAPTQEAQTAAIQADIQKVQVETPPELGLVRAEPDGSLVIAGSATPGSTVEIYADGKLLGVATVEETGDWVLVPDAPLPPGGVEIYVRDAQSGTVSAQSVVVAIDEDGASEPLVVATSPGQADSVLQGLSDAQDDRAKPDAAQQVAVAPPVRAPQETPPAGAPETPPAQDTKQDTNQAATTIAQEAEMPAKAPKEAVKTVAMADPEPVEAPPAPQNPAQEAQEVEKPVAATPGAEASKEREKSAQSIEKQEQAERLAAASDAMVEDLDALEKQVEALSIVRPGIDAIEIDGNRNFFAGSGQEGAIIRLYVDNEFVGDAKVNNGRWLLQTENVLENRSQRVRVDQLAPGSADVMARAEVEFIFEAFEPETAPAAPVPAPRRAEPVVVAKAQQTPAQEQGQQASSQERQPEPDLAQSPPQSTDPVPEQPKTDRAQDSETPQSAATGLQTDEKNENARAEIEPAPDSQASMPKPAPASEKADNVRAPQTVAAMQGQLDAPIEPVGAPAAGQVFDPVAPSPEPDFSIDSGIDVRIARPDEKTDGITLFKPGSDPAGLDVAANASAQETPPQEAADDESAPAREALSPPVANPKALPAPQPTGAAQANPQGNVPVLVAAPLGDPRDRRYASGKAIIRKGDNLWTIASRVYGSGYEYLSIYRANSEQIRNPDLIYPGQVFNLPKE